MSMSSMISMKRIFRNGTNLKLIISTNQIQNCTLNDFLLCSLTVYKNWLTPSVNLPSLSRSLSLTHTLTHTHTQRDKHTGRMKEEGYDETCRNPTLFLTSFVRASWQTKSDRHLKKGRSESMERYLTFHFSRPFFPLFLECLSN